MRPCIKKQNKQIKTETEGWGEKEGGRGKEGGKRKGRRKLGKKTFFSPCCKELCSKWKGENKHLTYEKLLFWEELIAFGNHTLGIRGQLARADSLLHHVGLWDWTRGFRLEDKCHLVSPRVSYMMGDLKQFGWVWRRMATTPALGKQTQEDQPEGYSKF